MIVFTTLAEEKIFLGISPRYSLLTFWPNVNSESLKYLIKSMVSRKICAIKVAKFISRFYKKPD